MRTPTILTNEGRLFTCETSEIREYIFPITEIASSISKLCRFNGHLAGDNFYSVAQHCVHCFDVAPENIKLACLLHDASEAYVTDIPGPYRQVFSLISKYIDYIQEIIYNKYEIITTEEMYKAVKEVDRKMFITELRQLASANNLYPDESGYNMKLDCWPHQMARNHFLNRFNNYMRKERENK